MCIRVRFAAAALAVAACLAPLASVAGDTRYHYDTLGRLVRVVYASGVVLRYSYDAAGNRTLVAGGPNRLPVAVNDGASVGASASVDIMVRANDSDPDGDPLTVTAVGTPVGGGMASIQGGGAHVRYTAPATGGTRTFTYTVSDDRGGAASATVTVNVANPNRAPTAVDDSASVNASASVDIMVRANDSDPDGDPLTVTAVGTPSGGGSAVIQSGGAHVRYTAPATGGARTFTYTISDGRGGSASAMVTVNVIGPNRPPVASNDWAEVVIGSSVSIPVLNNDSDPDADPLVIAGVATPTSGSATVGSGGVVNYTPTATGMHSFSYTVSDGRGGTATAIVYVNVTGQRPPDGYCQRYPDDPRCDW